MTDPRPGPAGLHLDPRMVVNLVALIAHAGFMLAVGAWYVAKIEGRIDAVEELGTNNSALIAQTRISVYSAGVDAARFDERLKAFDAQLQKFDRVLDRISVERTAPPRLQP